METPKTIETAADHLTLLFKELNVTAELLYQALEASADAVRSGRSPQALKLEEKAAAARDIYEVGKEILEEAETIFQSLPSIAPSQRGGSPSEEERSLLAILKNEMLFCRKYQQAAKVFLGRLEMLARESQVTNMGRLALEEAWTEVENLGRVKK